MQRFLCLLATLFLVPALCWGVIYLDEDFEGGSIFFNHDFPVRNETDLPELPLSQGINIRAYAPGYANIKVALGTTGGSVDATRAYLGERSYRLDSGQALAVTPGGFPYRNGTGFRLMQFAVNVDEATADLPVGTEVGRFTLNYTRDGGSNLTPQLAIALSLRVVEGNLVELTCENKGGSLGQLTGGAEDWILVSILTYMGVEADTDSGIPADQDSVFAARDPFTEIQKGPEIVRVPTGIHIYAKQGGDLRKVSLLRSDVLGEAWGNHSDKSTTAEIGWTFSALNGGRMFLDNLYWDSGGHQNQARGFDVEQAARMERIVGLVPNHLFSDNAVLQREQPVPVWGTSSPGTEVTVRLDTHEAIAVADSAGRWEAWLPAMPAGGPHGMSISGEGEWNFSNVMVGEVWVCGGQSNMAWRVYQANNGAAEIAEANYPDIRLFSVNFAGSAIPIRTVNGGPWVPCSPETIPEFSATGYYFGREMHTQWHPGVAVGLISSNRGATVAEAWTSQAAMEANDLGHLIGTQGPFGVEANTLFNAMINPLIPYGIRGVVWYQGESNAENEERCREYQKLFPVMMQDWRNRWGQGIFPFHYVQIANVAVGSVAFWPHLREAQLQSLYMPNAEMAVTIDIGDPNDHHPGNKQEVGRRLGLIAAAKVFGEPVVYSGPIYDRITIEGSAIRVHFHHVANGLADSNEGSLEGFEVAGEDGIFTAANAVIDGETVLVSAASVPAPVHVRYAWAPNPKADLQNSAGLPASPFRSNAPAPYFLPGPTVVKQWTVYD